MFDITVIPAPPPPPPPAEDIIIIRMDRTVARYYVREMAELPGVGNFYRKLKAALGEK